MVISFESNIVYIGQHWLRLNRARMKQAEESVSLNWRNLNVILGTNYDYGVGYIRPSVGDGREILLQCKFRGGRRPGNVDTHFVPRDAQARAGSGSKR